MIVLLYSIVSAFLCVGTVGDFLSQDTKLTIDKISKYNHESRSKMPSSFHNVDYEDSFTTHDFIGFLALKFQQSFNQEIKYLEVGISRGRNLLSQVHLFPQNSHIFAVFSSMLCSCNHHFKCFINYISGRRS